MLKEVEEKNEYSLRPKTLREYSDELYIHTIIPNQYTNKLHKTYEPQDYKKYSDSRNDDSSADDFLSGNGKDG